MLVTWSSVTRTWTGGLSGFGVYDVAAVPTVLTAAGADVGGTAVGGADGAGAGAGADDGAAEGACDCVCAIIACSFNGSFPAASSACLASASMGA